MALSRARLVDNANVTSIITGAGTYPPMIFYTGGAERMRISNTGPLMVNTASITTSFGGLTAEYNGTIVAGEESDCTNGVTAIGTRYGYGTLSTFGTLYSGGTSLGFAVKPLNRSGGWASSVSYPYPRSALLLNAPTAGGFSFYGAGTTTTAVGSSVSMTSYLTGELNKTLALQGASTQSGTGISFPASTNLSSDPNTLDDYEEGTWTPVIAGVSSGATTNGSYGNYTKIGNRVILNFTFVNPSAATLVGSWIITGVPFSTYGPNSEYHGGVVTYSRAVPTSTNSTGLSVQIAGSVAQFGIRWMYSNGTETAPVTGNVPANNMLLSGTIVYQTNA